MDVTKTADATVAAMAVATVLRRQVALCDTQLLQSVATAVRAIVASVVSVTAVQHMPMVAGSCWAELLRCACAVSFEWAR